MSATPRSFVNRSPGWAAVCASTLALSACAGSPAASVAPPGPGPGLAPQVAAAVSAPPRATHAFEIWRYSGVSITPGDADRILADSGGLLTTKDADDDVACALAFQRDGSIESFTLGDGSVDSEADFIAVSRLPGQVKVVERLNWCGALTPNVIGCAALGGGSIVVARFAPALEGQLWAHEFGHNQGLLHVEREHALMRSFIGESHRRVDAGECDAFLDGGAAPSRPGEPLAGRGGARLILARGTDADAGESAEAPAAVEAFVRRIYPHGLPYEAARRYGPEAVATLAPMLRDPAEALYWPNIAVAIGAAGGQDAAPILISFVEDPGIGGGAVSEDAVQRAKTSALMALGYLANAAKSRIALTYLASGLSLSSWDRAPEPEMPVAAKARRDRAFAKHCALGLALSGAPEARAALERQRQESMLASSAQRFLGVDRPLDPELLASALETHAEVAEMGLEAYYRAKRR